MSQLRLYCDCTNSIRLFFRAGVRVQLCAFQHVFRLILRRTEIFQDQIALRISKKRFLRIVKKQSQTSRSFKNWKILHSDHLSLSSPISVWVGRWMWKEVGLRKDYSCWWSLICFWWSCEICFFCCWLIGGWKKNNFKRFCFKIEIF